MRVEIRSQALNHEPLARRHRPQCRQLVNGERPGIGVREEASLVEHETTHRSEVLHRRGVPVLTQPLSSRFVTIFGSLAQGEQRLGASSGRTSAGEIQHGFW